MSLSCNLSVVLSTTTIFSTCLGRFILFNSLLVMGLYSHSNFCWFSFGYRRLLILSCFLYPKFSASLHDWNLISFIYLVAFLCIQVLAPKMSKLFPPFRKLWSVLMLISFLCCSIYFLSKQYIKFGRMALNITNSHKKFKSNHSSNL